MSTAEMDKGRDAEDHDEDEETSEEEEESEEESAAPARAKSKDARTAQRRGRQDDAKSERIESAVAREGSSPASFLKNTWTITRRETRAYFDSLVAYVVIGGSTLGLGIYFFLMQSGGFWQVDRASMSRLFEFLPWALVTLVIPLITMRSIAEEKRSGTIELLITMPIRDSEVILGKYAAAMAMTLILLAATLLYPIAMFVWPWHLGALDWGPVWAGYLGLVFFAAAGISVGMLFSSVTESQIIAFFLTAMVLLFLHSIGLFAEFLPGAVGDTVNFVSISSRYAPFERGLIDTRAIVYFTSIAVLCLLVAFRSLESRKWT